MRPGALSIRSHVKTRARPAGLYVTRHRPVTLHARTDEYAYIYGLALDVANTGAVLYVEVVQTNGRVQTLQSVHAA